MGSSLDIAAPVFPEAYPRVPRVSLAPRRRQTRRRSHYVSRRARQAGAAAAVDAACRLFLGDVPAASHTHPHTVHVANERDQPRLAAASRRHGRVLRTKSLMRRRNTQPGVPSGPFLWVLRRRRAAGPPVLSMRPPRACCCPRIRFAPGPLPHTGHARRCVESRLPSRAPRPRPPRACFGLIAPLRSARMRARGRGGARPRCNACRSVRPATPCAWVARSRTPTHAPSTAPLACSPAGFLTARARRDPAEGLVIPAGVHTWEAI